MVGSQLRAPATRTMVQLKLAAVLAKSSNPPEAAAIYDGLIKAGQELPAADLKLRHAEVLASESPAAGTGHVQRGCRRWP